MIKRILICCISALFCCTCIFMNPVWATQVTDTSSRDTEFQIVIEYSTTEDSMSQYQLDSEALSQPTNALLIDVLQSEYIRIALWQAKIYSSSSEPLIPRYERFNGFIELISRGDFEEELLQYVREASVNQQWHTTDAYLAMQSLLTKDVVLGTLSEASLYEITQITAQNQSRVAGNEIIDMGSISYSQNGVVYTVGGQVVPVLEPSRELTSEEAFGQNENGAEISGATRLSTPTAKYNCHSYAWYLMSTSNPHWIEAIDIYLSDSATTEVTSENVQVGDIVVYYNDNGPCHSAVVTGINDGELVLQSKWGVAGVYSHGLSNVPETFVMSSGEICCNIYRYHDYERTATGEHYHLGNYHHFEYEYVCGICNHTYTLWTKVLCSGPPCQLTGTGASIEIKEEEK